MCEYYDMNHNSKQKRYQNFVDYYLALYTALILLSVFDYNFHDFIGKRSFLLLTFLILALEIKITKNKYPKIIILLTLSLLTMFINGSGGTSVLQYLTLLLIFHRETKLRLNNHIANILLVILLIVNVYLSYQAITGYYPLYIWRTNNYGGKIWMINPNHFGVLLVYISTVLSTWFYLRAPILKKTVVNSYLFFNFVSIYFLQSRASLFALFVYAVILNIYLFGIEARRSIESRKMKIVLIGGILFSLLYPIFLVYVYISTNYGKNASLISSGKFFSKAVFSGRERLWSKFFKDLLQSPKNILFGLGSKYKFSSVKTSLNSHNSFLNVYNNNGLILLVVYIKSIYQQWLVNYNNNCDRNPSGFSSIVSLGIFSVLVLSTFENVFSTFSYGILYLIYFSGLNISTTKIQSE